MRRAELVQQLEALGWRATGTGSGANHELWAHPRASRKLAVPKYDLILDAVGAAILDDARVEGTKR